MKKIALIIGMNLLGFAAFAQKPGNVNEEKSDSSILKVFSLGEVLISAEKQELHQQRIVTADMEKQNKMEVSRALNMLSGVNLTASGQRNESTLSVRGFDLRQTPVFMDGIPVYVPYDGYVDLARFTTFDLAAIDVSKGMASVLYGPNSMGGAINLISRKPLKRLEYDGSLGIIQTNGFKGNVNIGSRWGNFYVQATYSMLHRDAYQLSAHFDSTKFEDGKERDNSYREDQKIHAKVGWEKEGKAEYALGYINQQGSKGNPLYCGEDKLNAMYSKPRYWQWPNWDKETYYFLSNNVIGKHSTVKLRLYYDVFKNMIKSFDDGAYAIQSKPYAFTSNYNDYTYGSSVEYGTTFIPKHALKVAVHFKEDVHRENNLNEPVRVFDDQTYTIAVEDVFSINDKLILTPGFSYSNRKNVKAEDYNSKTNIISDYSKAAGSHSYNAQLGIYYYLKSNQRLGVSYAHKTRFATIKDRYSYRMGTAIPNPGLQPEATDNFELNYQTKLFEKVQVQMAVFYSHLTNSIMSVSNVEPGKFQMQNTGTAAFKGAEIDVRYKPIKKILLSMNFTYLERYNLSNSALRFTDVPNAKCYAFVQYEPIKRLTVIASAESNSFRYSTSYGTRADAYSLANLIVSYRLFKFMSAEAGLNNIFDKNYSLVEGYPEEGRNFFISIRFFNH